MRRELTPGDHADHRRWIEDATPRYNVSSYDWHTDNLAFFARRPETGCTLERCEPPSGCALAGLILSSLRTPSLLAP
jgi:hypothetical protein